MCTLLLEPKLSFTCLCRPWRFHLLRCH